MNNYLPYETTLQPDAIEKVFCEEFKKLKVNPMTQAESEMLIRLMLIKEEDVSGMYEELMSKKNEQMALGLHVLNKRFCEIYKFAIDKRMMVFLGIILKSFGEVVMYGTYFLYFCKKNNKTFISLDDFCMKLFPWGCQTKMSYLGFGEYKK